MNEEDDIVMVEHHIPNEIIYAITGDVLKIHECLDRIDISSTIKSLTRQRQVSDHTLSIRYDHSHVYSIRHRYSSIEILHIDTFASIVRYL
jgi:hypothetical protein